ncbi:ribosomal protection-like ABC-F family protein [Paenibacillus hodogayensis]|uniref:Ribosomal protection-like ABC-F family protein n=1 Tax=Paenibacillus hodogayensis TaxID=279208 RepID=A0ABV5W8G0_9BACL
MLRLEANQAERRIGDRLLFRIEGVLRLYERERVGLVGVNGAGKSTLLSVLAGLEEPDAGTVTRYGSAAIVRQLDDAEPLPDGGDELPQAEEYAAMSGGERTRWKWERALRQQAALLFADEPTSHLDTDGTALVEEQLRAYDGTVLLISHDRTLLDAVCTRILELEDGSLHDYAGNFSEYVRQKELRRERERFEYEQYAKEKRRLEQAVVDKSEQAKGMRKKVTGKINTEARLGKDMFNRRKSKMEKTVQTIQKRIEQLEVKEKPKTQDPPIFDVRYHKPIYAKEAISLERVSASFGERVLFQPFSCSISPGMRLGIVGANGSGKTTLMRMIMDQKQGIRMALASRIGYFDQKLDMLRDDRTVLEQVASSSDYPESAIRTALARMLLKRDDVFKPVSVLSGGERVKTALAQLFMSECNMLLLDEPTNYLDIFAREQLARVLREYPGTLLFCSHDRYFLNQLATHLLVIENGRWTLHYGGYAEYAERKRKRKADEAGPKSGSGADKEATDVRPIGLTQTVQCLPLTHVEREEEIMRLELELTGVLGRLSAPGKYDDKELLENRYTALLRQLRQLR